MSSKFASGTSAATLMLAVSAFAVSAGVAASPASAACSPDYNYYWTTGGHSYKTIGVRTGERNGGGAAVTLAYSKAATTSVASSVSAEASFSVDAGIASVNATLHASATKTYTKGKTVTGSLSIPAGKYGYIEPKAEYTAYTYHRSPQTPRCGTNASLGTLTAITSVPFFSTCVASAPCTPTP